MQQSPPPPRNTNSELESVLLSHGGLFWLEGDHTEWIRGLFNAVVARFTRHRDYAEQSLYTDKPRAIEFGFLCGSELNAFAYASREGTTPEFDFIGMNVGVLFTLTNIFGRILAHPDTFPDVGNPKLEVIAVHSLAYLTTDVMRSGHEPISPNCPVRSIFAGELAQVALDFLFFHELSHLRNGHVELVRYHLSLTHWPEAIGTKQTAENLKIRQALEMDADCGAVLHSLNAAFRFKDMLALSSKSAPKDILTAMHSAYGSSERATRTVGFSAYILFRIFDTTEWLWHQQPSSTHPLPPLRMFFIGPTLYEIFSQRKEYGYDAEKFISDNLNVMLEAEAACGLIKGDEPDMRGIFSVVKDHKYLPYLDEFKTNWSSIRPTLEKYKRGGKLAP